MRINRTKTHICGAAILMLSAATLAQAAGLDDAKAGLDALNRGDYAAAIPLFNRATSSKQLSPMDLELAYVKVAQAYLAEGQNGEAVAELDKAQKLDPDDPEAADLRKQVLDGPPIVETELYIQSKSKGATTVANPPSILFAVLSDIAFSGCKVAVRETGADTEFTDSSDLGNGRYALYTENYIYVSAPAHHEFFHSGTKVSSDEAENFAFKVADEETARRLSNAWTHLIALCKPAARNPGAADPFK